MKRIGTILLSFFSAALAFANENAPSMNSQIFTKGDLIESPNFTGKAWLQRLMTNSDEFDVVVSDVVFEAGSRNAWHYHPGGQILIATSGKGNYQEKGKPVQVLMPGDVVAIKPNVVHWHGAAPDSAFIHIAINTKVHLGATVWSENVAEAQSQTKPISIAEQGSFAVGGTMIKKEGAFDPMKLNPEGQTYHGDHAYIFYQIPENARKLPLVFLHGFGQSKKTWETTPDGREGFQNIFLREGYGVYLIDQPRRGAAGRSMQPAEIKPTPDEQFWFSIFRLGKWPNFHDGVSFPKDEASLEQFFRQMTPNIGPHDNSIVADSLNALFEKIGGGVLVTHSAGGAPGWYAAIKNPNIKGIVSYEPGTFLFPEGEVPEPIASSSPFGALKAEGVPMEDFMKLMQIPIVVYYGDNIPTEPSDDPGLDNWRVRLQMAKLWAETAKKYGGNVTLVELPKAGIKGNTHFPFADLNNQDVARLMSDFLNKQGLDKK